MSEEKTNRFSKDEEAVIDDASAADGVTSDESGDEFEKQFKAVFEDEEAPQKPKEKFRVMDPDGFTAGIYDWIRCMVFAVAIVVCCLTFGFRLVEVDGTSMNDTLAHRDKVIVTDLFYKPHNNDIIVISHAENYQKPIIKRVIAIGGQNVKLDYENDRIFVDGIELSEPYLKDVSSTFSGNFGDKYLPLNDDGSFVVPEGKVFVMGDNRQVSLDSRSEKINLIDVHDIIGKAQAVVWPFNHFGGVYK